MVSDLVAFSKFWQYSVGPNSERLKSLKKQSWCPKATNSQRFVAPALLGLQWSVWSLEVSFVAIWGSLWYSFCKYLCKYLYIPVLMYTDFSHLFTSIENCRVTQVVNVLMNVWMNLSLLARFNDLMILLPTLRMIIEVFGLLATATLHHSGRGYMPLGKHWQTMANQPTWTWKGNKRNIKTS